MDPDTALQRLRAAVTDVVNHPDDEAVSELDTAFSALDEWLSNGGFLPKDWNK